MSGQNKIYQEIEKRSSQFDNLEVDRAFERSTQKSSTLIDPEVLDRFTMLELHGDFRSDILKNRHSEIVVSLPLDETSNIEVQLYEINLLSPDFALIESSNETVPFNYQHGMHYWGIVKGIPESVVAFSVTHSEVFGNIYLNNESYSVGKLEGSENYVIYRNQDLKSTPDFTCFTDDIKHYVGREIREYDKSATGPNNCVQMYLEIRDEIYNNKGSTQATADYILGAFSQVILIYEKESVQMTVKTLYIWTSDDPYSGTSTSNFLSQFQSQVQSNNPARFDGDLYHLIGYAGGGGIAYVNVLCYTSSSGIYQTGYSGINSGYNNLPSYSWTVEVLTHEIGHNLGSRHTHACVWDGVAGNGDYTGTNPLDNCGPTAGYSEGCTTSNPLPQGTVMSYCHLTSTGINLSVANPFGEEPGDLIRNNVYSANCLNTCCGEPGESCDDGNDCTVNDVWNNNCGCAGTPDSDQDSDGVCDALDQCPGMDDNMIGEACNDGIACTVGETYDNNCNCTGGIQKDDDNDGVACNVDPDDNDPCTPVATSLQCLNCQVYNSESFENGMGIWNDGGSDCYLSSSYANTGNYCVGLQDNSGIASSMYTNTLPFSGVEFIGLTFSYYAVGMENGEDFWIQISTNGGSSYSTVASYAAGNDFQNNVRYNEEIFIQGVTLTNNVVIRIICDATADSDDVYIDDVVIYVCQDVCELENDPCNDGDPCTINDVYDSNCNCAGTPIADTDGDGICDTEDNCPLTYGEIGDPCNDNDPCTLNDQINASCNCTGTPATDTDGDGICDIIDTDDDNDGVADGSDSAPLNPKVCRDQDSDGCDDCSQNPESTSSPKPWDSYTPSTTNDGTDSDGDGICNSSDECPLDSGEIGDPCNDNDDCTINDQLNANCDCVGTLLDSDGDGVCDGNDQCPGFNDNLIGTPCNDGQACTSGETWQPDCSCGGGTFDDADGDGVCDANDQCPGMDDSLIGQPCNDGNACTVGETYDNNCNCTGGTEKDEDNDGVPCSSDPNDNDPCVPNNTSLDCVGCEIFNSEDFESGMGIWNDGGSDCLHISAYPNSGSYSVRIRDNSGVGSSMYTNSLNLSAYENIAVEFSYYAVGMEPGEDFWLQVSTNGGASFTTVAAFVSGSDFFNQIRYNEQILIDGITPTSSMVIRFMCDASANADEVFIDDVVIQGCASNCDLENDPCNDGNPCTVNDKYNANCNCVGTFQDSDNDGICDANDQCPGQDDSFIGQPCSDGDPCTIGETYDSNCNCSGGIFQDSDGDGVCNANDSCPGFNNNLIGTPCDDGSDCTTGETWQANCTCGGGTFDDADGDGVCDANDQCPGINDNLIGQSCDDGDDCTEGETYDNNCNCTGGTQKDDDNDGVLCNNDPDDSDPCNPNPDAPVCASGGCDDFNFENFESGMGIWNDGGSDCLRISANANSGSYSVRIRDNSGIASSMFTNSLNLSAYENIAVEFSYYAVGMEPGEDFWLQVSTNGGASFTTVAAFVSGSDFFNQIRYNEQILLDGITPTSSMVIRFMCDASANADEVFIDDVVIQGCASNCDLENDPCNDGNPCTVNDKYNANCNCIGTFQDSDQDGVCNANDDCPGMDDNLIGTPCDDGDPCTTGEIYLSNCNCGGGVFQDSDGDGVCNANDSCPGFNNNLIGTACDDGSDCTTGETWQANCTCGGGTFDDADGDGVCDANDQCPGLNDNLIGQPCDDGDDCTEGETYDSNCNCTGGTQKDDDNDGVLCNNDPDDSDPCNPNPDASVCASGGCEDFNFENFESGMGIWNDGGSDCLHTAQYANSGSYSVRIRDNSGVASSMYTDPLDLSAFTNAVMEFSFYAVGMETGEDFWIQVSSNGGSSFTTVASYVSGSDFVNNTRYSAEVSFDGITLTSSMVFRIMCDASANADEVFIDDVVIEACGGAPSVANTNPSLPENDEFITVKAILIPNPVISENQLIIQFSQSLESADVMIYNLAGEILLKNTFDEMNSNRAIYENIKLPQGTYFVRITTGNQVMVEKLVVVH